LEGIISVVGVSGPEGTSPTLHAPGACWPRSRAAPESNFIADLRLWASEPTLSAKAALVVVAEGAPSAPRLADVVRSVGSISADEAILDGRGQRIGRTPNDHRSKRVRSLKEAQ